MEDIAELKKENARLLKIARKMHTWIFLHCDDEQKVYDELGISEEENRKLGYGGQFRMEGSDKDERF